MSAVVPPQSQTIFSVRLPTTCFSDVSFLSSLYLFRYSVALSNLRFGRGRLVFRFKDGFFDVHIEKVSFSKR